MAVPLLEGDAILHHEYNPNVTDPTEIPFPCKKNDNEPPEANEPMQDGNEECVNGDEDHVDDGDHQQMQFKNHDADYNDDEEEGPPDYYQVEIQPTPPMNNTSINYFDNDFVTTSCEIYAQD